MVLPPPRPSFVGDALTSLDFIRTAWARTKEMGMLWKVRVKQQTAEQ